MRVVDDRAIARARKKHCEHCGTGVGPFEVHHLKSRGSGGDDVDANLINLCVGCHDDAHRALIPRDRLLLIIQSRDGGH